MRHTRSPSIAVRLAGAVALLALAAAAPARAAGWRLEPIGASEGVAGLHELQFDGEGRALLSWNGALQGRTPPLFGGLALRDPAGGWLRPPDLAGVEPATAQIHLFGVSRALLVAREARTSTSRRRLVVAEGASDGGFGGLGVLDDFVSAHWSDANRDGAAIVAWVGERAPFVRVAERAAGEQRFGAARDLAVARRATVAIGPQGDRVLVWRAGPRLAARFAPTGGDWGPTVRFGHVQASDGLRISALVAPGGRVVVTWGRAGRTCGASVRDRAGRWRSRSLERHCGPTGAVPDAAPALPIADEHGATYVAWTGRSRDGQRVVKLARVGSGASRRPLVLSRERGAVLDAVAAGPQRALAVTYSAPRPMPRKPFLAATYAAVRRGGGAFGRATRLTPATVAASRGSRVAFQPLTGEPVVAIPYLVGRTVAVGAAVGPPAPAP